MREADAEPLAVRLRRLVGALGGGSGGGSRELGRERRAEGVDARAHARIHRFVRLVAQARIHGAVQACGLVAIQLRDDGGERGGKLTAGEEAAKGLRLEHREGLLGRLLKGRVKLARPERRSPGIAYVGKLSDAQRLEVGRVGHVHLHERAVEEGRTVPRGVGRVAARLQQRVLECRRGRQLPRRRGVDGGGGRRASRSTIRSDGKSECAYCCEPPCKSYWAWPCIGPSWVGRLRKRECVGVGAERMRGETRGERDRVMEEGVLSTRGRVRT